MLPMILLGFLAPTWGLARAGEIEVSVRPADHGVFELEGSFTATASTATAWEVLTDYERLPSFVPSMRSSRVRERAGDRLLLEQDSIGRVLIFRKTVHVLLDVREERPVRITFDNVSKASFEVYQGSWQLADAPGGVRVTYRLHAKGGFVSPGFVTRGVSRRMVLELLGQVRAEMERRALATTLPR